MKQSLLVAALLALAVSACGKTEAPKPAEAPKVEAPKPAAEAPKPADAQAGMAGMSGMAGPGRIVVAGGGGAHVVEGGHGEAGDRRGQGGLRPQRFSSNPRSSRSRWLNSRKRPPVRRR